MALFFCLLYFTIFASIRVTRTSKAMQTTAIGTVANSLPQNEVILLTLISKRYILFAELRNILFRVLCTYMFMSFDNVMVCTGMTRLISLNTGA